MKLRRLPLLLFSFLLVNRATQAMRLDPERIAARLRIEERAEEKTAAGRGRRQLATPKEISIQVTAPLFSSRLFDYGEAAGDAQLSSALDSAEKLQLQHPIRFFGDSSDHIYILSNGAIAFDGESKQYKANLFPNGTRIIAPFYNRNDLRNGGKIFFREIRSGRVLERGQSEIRYQYDQSLQLLSAVVVTWEKMQPVGAKPLPSQNTNTFQAALFITKNRTFANFIYSNIGWTQGAEAGFNRGDGMAHYALPTSGTGQIMYLEEYGNTGIPGEWMFELADSAIIRCKAGVRGDTCDQECEKGSWGADCAACCHCSGESCESVTGSCAMQGGCGSCWDGASCQLRKEHCQTGSNVTCAVNAISFSESGRCEEVIKRCECLQGFIGDGQQKCIDVNECEEQPRVCHEHALCTNTPGRFFCQCKEGFTGDGVRECLPSLFYKSASPILVPEGETGKAEFDLKSPLLLFGTRTNSLTITSTGVVSGSPSESGSMRAVAPAFTPSSSGRVTVGETNDADVLSELTRRIREATALPSFSADSVVIVTAVNVTEKEKAGNKGSSFQSLLISGQLSPPESATFVIIIYKELAGAGGSEAAIFSGDSAGSVVLPGSGTEGVEQLSSLSNIGQPGQWLFRIDDSSVQPCPRRQLVPPYCTEPKATSSFAISHSASKIRNPEDGKPSRNSSIATATLPPPVFHSASSLPSPTQSPSRRLPPIFQSTPHKPLVSLTEDDLEGLGADAFEVTFPPFVTVIPEIFTSSPKGTAKNRSLPNFNTKEPTTTASPSITTLRRETTTSGSTPTMFTTEMYTEHQAHPVKNMSLDSTTQNIFVITTTTKQPLRQTRPHSQPPKLVTGHEAPGHPSPATTTPGNPFNSEIDSATANKLAILIPAAIVLVWLTLLVVIAVVVCCRKRSTERRLRSSYGPAYGVRGVSGVTKRGVAQPGYEDHLEKAARLSSEMTAYNQTGRVSLYGSYWNVNNVSPSTNTTSLGGGGGCSREGGEGGGGSSRHQNRANTPSYNNGAFNGTTQRYVYTGRY